MESTLLLDAEHRSPVRMMHEQIWKRRFDRMWSTEVPLG
jgi:hypothetical protein